MPNDESDLTQADLTAYTGGMSTDHSVQGTPPAGEGDAGAPTGTAPPVHYAPGTQEFDAAALQWAIEKGMVPATYVRSQTPVEIAQPQAPAKRETPVERATRECEERGITDQNAWFNLVTQYQEEATVDRVMKQLGPMIVPTVQNTVIEKMKRGAEAFDEEYAATLISKYPGAMQDPDAYDLVRSAAIEKGRQKQGAKTGTAQAQSQMRQASPEPVVPQGQNNLSVPNSERDQYAYFLRHYGASYKTDAERLAAYNIFKDL